MHGRIVFQKVGSIHCTEIGCKNSLEWFKMGATNRLSQKGPLYLGNKLSTDQKVT